MIVPSVFWRPGVGSVRAKVPAKPFGKPPAPHPKSSSRHLSIRPVLFYGGFAALAATNVLTLVGFLMAPDVSRLFAQQNGSVFTAYEDRIAQLRLEVDRLQSRHYAQAGDINLQLQELAQTQEVLVEQHQYVKQLAEKAAALGIDSAGAPAAADAASDNDLTPAPDAPAATDGDAGAQVAAAARTVNQMMEESRLALATLSDEASAKTDKIVGTLATVGIKPKLPDGDADAEGGPLLPPVDGVEATSLIDEANGVAAALDRFKAARDAAALAPIHKPVKTMTRVSSIFGNRKDPFTGRLAFHSGIDFAAPRGTTVLSAGAGIVSFVGQISGYGNVVEVTHSGGLITRYGHLSAFLVKEGDPVSTGSPIARVGSTGRSTGPHLHFEVRRSDNAVDPARYLNAGKILQKVLSG
jgi:murein DD-endopeptidase MepM/ murein hydrolase activator NlpD